jgi:cytoskeleton protein RodZ
MAEQVASVEQLIAAREARGLSPDDVVRQLKLAPRQVQAIEAGDWAALPGGAFVKGALRGYGRLLAVDVQPLLDALGAQVRTSDLRPASSLHEPMPRGGMLGFGSGGSGHRVAWVVLAIAGLTALALFFGRGVDLASVPSWLSRGAAPASAPEPSPQAPAGLATGEARPASGTTTETVPITVPVPPAEPAGGASPPASGAVPAASGVASGPTASAAAGAALPPAGGTAPAPATTPAAAAAPAATSLQMRFGRDSWVEVRAADGTVLLSGVQKADSQSALPAAGPVSLVIGNADHVSVEFGGRAVDLKPHIKGSVARLTLP